MANTFSSAFTENDLMESTADVLAGKFVTLGEYQVTAGELIQIGYGKHDGQGEAQGRIYLDLETTTAGTKIDGLVQLIAYSPQDHPLSVLAEFRSESLRNGENDRLQQRPLPVHQKALSEDRKLVLAFKADTNGTVSQTNSTLLMDVTKHLVK